MCWQARTLIKGEWRKQKHNWGSFFSCISAFVIDAHHHNNTHIQRIVCHTHKHMKENKINWWVFSDRGWGKNHENNYFLRRKGDAPQSMRRRRPGLRTIYAWITLLLAKGNRPFVHWFMQASINLPIYLSVHTYIHTCTQSSMHPSSHASTDPLMHSCIHPSTHLTIFHTFIPFILPFS